MQVILDIAFEVAGKQHRVIVGNVFGMGGGSWVIELDGFNVGTIVKYNTGLQVFISFPKYQSGYYTRNILYGDDYRVLLDLFEDWMSGSSI